LNAILKEIGNLKILFRPLFSMIQFLYVHYFSEKKLKLVKRRKTNQLGTQKINLPNYFDPESVLLDSSGFFSFYQTKYLNYYNNLMSRLYHATTTQYYVSLIFILTVVVKVLMIYNNIYNIII